jgi:hypothetical protein
MSNLCAIEQHRQIDYHILVSAVGTRVHTLAFQLAASMLFVFVGAQAWAPLLSSPNWQTAVRIQIVNDLLNNLRVFEGAVSTARPNVIRKYFRIDEIEKMA